MEEKNASTDHPVETVPPSRRRIDALIIGGVGLLVLALCLLPTPSSVPSAEPAQNIATGWSSEGASSPSTEVSRLGDVAEGLSAWTATTDAAMGGTSEVDLQAVDGALRLHGEIRSDAVFPWAGGTLAVGESKGLAKDLSHHDSLRFRLRGEPRQVAVMVISGSSRHMPPTQFVRAEAEWTEVVLPLDGFLGADLKAVQGIAFSAVQTPGRFAFEIDDVELH